MPDAIMTEAAPQHILKDDPPQYMCEENAAARRNLGIQSQDAAWKEKLHDFTILLESPVRTVQQILSENFTQAEAQMIIPADRESVRQMQAANTKRYNLLLLARFPGIRPNLATKLTMLYFGLPVEPMALPLDELMMDIDPREPEGPYYDVEPPLHFLSAHVHRNWGKDTIREKESISYPLPIENNEPLPRLRGGDESDGGKPDGSESDGLESLKGDSYLYESSPIRSTDEWRYLYGYQGCVPFVPQKWKTFATAMRQLLSFSPHDHEEDSFTLIQFNVKTKEHVQTIQDALPLTEESKTLKFLWEHFPPGTSARAHKSCCALFVKRTKDWVPLYWKPKTHDFKADLVRLGRPAFDSDEDAANASGATSYAYLAFPHTKGKFAAGKFGANQYAPCVRTAIEVLVGKPEPWVVFHDSVFTIHDRNTNDDPDETRPTYGAIHQHQEVLDRLHPCHNVPRQWMVEDDPVLEGEITFVLPNYFPRDKDKCRSSTLVYPPEKEPVYRVVDAHKKILAMIRSSFGADVEKLSSLRLFPGTTLLGHFRETDGYMVLVNASVSEWKKNVDDALNRLFTEHEGESFVLILPQWQSSHRRLCAGWAPDLQTQLPAFNSSIINLQQVVHKLCGLDDEGRTYVPEEHYLLLQPRERPDTEDTDYPAFLVGPKTTDDEWTSIICMITTRYVDVDFVDKDRDWVGQMAVNNVWGPRYYNLHLGPPPPPERAPLSNSAPPSSEEQPLDEEASEHRKTRQVASAPAERAALGKHSLPSTERRPVNQEAPGHPEPRQVVAPSEESAPSDDIVPPSNENRPPSGEVTETRKLRHADAAPEKRVPLGEIVLPSVEQEEPPVEERSPTHNPIWGSETGDIEHGGSQRSDYQPHGSDPGDGQEAQASGQSLPPVDKNDRDRTWATQPSVYDEYDPSAPLEKSGARIPINAPPLEQILRTSSSVPMFSKTTLTPTEQAELQHSFWMVRNVALSRITPCSYKDCGFTYRLDDDEGIKRHLQQEHSAQKCMFCDDFLFDQRSEEQKRAHLRSFHRQELLNALADSPLQPPANPFSPRDVPSSNLRDDTDPPPRDVTRTRLSDGVCTPQRNDGNVNVPNSVSTEPVERPMPQRAISLLPQKWYDFCGPLTEKNSAKYCPVVDCPEPVLYQHGAAGIYDHYEEHHPELDPECPFCKLRFCGPSKDSGSVDVTRPAEEIIKHYECHVGALWDALPEVPLADDEVIPPPVRCPLFKECHTSIGHMGPEEFIRHLDAAHALVPRQSRQSVALVRERVPRYSLQNHPGPRLLPALNVTRTGAIIQAESDGGSRLSTTQADVDRPSAARSSTARPRVAGTSATRPRASRPNATQPSATQPISTSKHSTAGPSAAGHSASSGSYTRTEPEKTSGPVNPPDATASLANNESEEAATLASGQDGDAHTGRFEQQPQGSSDEPLLRGRTLKRKSRAGKTSKRKAYTTPSPRRAKTPRRRSASPDWDEKLGPGDSDYDPEEGMYCSRCLRKVPKENDRSRGRSLMGRKTEMEFHVAGDHCCKVRQGVGSAENLPNHSGWICKADLPDRITRIKDNFLKRYPAYSRTVYPVHKRDHNTSIWRSDPNNEANQAAWGMPWPPYEGHPPFPGGWLGPEDTSLGDGKDSHPPSGRLKRRSPRDQAYLPQSDPETEDSLRPDFDDLHSKKRRRPEDPGFRPDADSASESEPPPAGPAKKKAKTGTKAATTTGTKTKKSCEAVPSKKEPARRSARRAASKAASETGGK